MWFVRMFVAAALFAAALLFATLNLQESVDIRLGPGTSSTYHVQLVFALFVAFILGAFTWFVLSLAREVRAHRETAALRRDVQQLRAELSALRNLPVEDALSPRPPADTSAR